MLPENCWHSYCCIQCTSKIQVILGTVFCNTSHWLIWIFVIFRNQSVIEYSLCIVRWIPIIGRSVFKHSRAKLHEHIGLFIIVINLPLYSTLLNVLVIILSSGLGVSPIWTISDIPTIPCDLCCASDMLW